MNNSDHLSEKLIKKLECLNCGLGVKDCKCSDNEEHYHFVLRKQKGDKV